MGPREKTAALAGAGGEHQRVSAGPAECFESGDDPRSVGEALQIERHGAGVFVGDERFEYVDGSHVELVADRVEARHTQPGPCAEAGDLGTELTALRDDRQPARCEVPPGESEFRRGVEQPEAVRSDHPRARLAQQRGEFGLVGAEPGGDGEERATPLGERVPDDGQDVVRRHAQGDEVGGLWQVVHRRTAGLAEDLCGTAVDQPHLSPAGSGEGTGGEPVAPFGAVLGGTDDGDGRRVDEGLGKGHGRSPGCGRG